MKNLHVIPTDKPSKLVYLTKKGKEVYKDLRLFDKPMPIILDSENQHIYITSDEEIKEGAWRCDIELNRIEKGKETGTFKNWKKIILTTDHDLIKDGVQAIDDEFLEWFVKNPACEYVDVKYQYLKKIQSVGKYLYKIIIPQEEPKQDTVGKVFYESTDKTITVYRQETLEEAAEKRIPTSTKVWDLTETRRNDFSAGAKWQQEQDNNKYSEEIINILDNVRHWETWHNSYKVVMEKFFEQFKEK